MQKILWAIPLTLVLLCTACSQDEIVTTITDGAEAATVAGMLALTADPITAPFVGVVRTGLTEAAAGAINIMEDADSTMTLQQLLDLAFSQDPNLSKLQSVVNFCLPIIMDISEVKDALNKAVQNINPDVRADVIAFFTGIQAGLGDGPQVTVASIVARNPHLQKAAAKMGGKFDPQALVNALKTAKK